MQGLLKHEGKAKFGEQYTKWQKQAAEFEIDGHAPIRQAVIYHAIMVTARPAIRTVQ